ncbi:MAG: bifunctional molybdopterin-guanine dinucleotide biosynthesis adaptor protein MobB/molybdopterin molybdotransferase MoeA [Marinosulfonomonas sp.]
MIRVFGVVGWKNAGKTGLMERLVRNIVDRGFTVSTIKHAHHSFDVDHPGKDSHRHRMAGATEVLLSSRKRWALMHENTGSSEAELASLLSKIEPVDLVLIEGYKGGPHPKVEAHRAETGNGLIAHEDQTIRAIASDTELSGMAVPVFDLDDTDAVAEFILEQVNLVHRKEAKTKTGDARSQLRNDCFALPPGVDWVPVDTALSALKDSLTPGVGTQTLPVSQALHRIVALDVPARRSNPPAANSAVDGYGFAHDTLPPELDELRLVPGRAAAGVPFDGVVPPGAAVRILTGALIPAGVDTVVLQEDVTVSDDKIRFDGAPKRFANTRKAGEDIVAGEIALEAGHQIDPTDIAFLSATGSTDIEVFRKLRVGVISTGDEIVSPGQDTPPDKTFDANRPMLLSLIEKWGYQPVDLGHVADDRDQLRARFEKMTPEVDAIFTSGGASAGEEDHVSALLKDQAALTSWRIAMKPGRPLALAVWNGTPVFGLPGNPVAALVCTLVFGRPALSALAGGGWIEPQGFTVPAAFEKNKKPGRREYLRAKMTPSGSVEVFASEGSGRISGLSWADGLVELSDGAQIVKTGDPVTYYPFSSFGL